MMEILLLFLLVGGIKVWIEWHHETEQRKTALRARERFLCRRALEKRGFTVITDATSGEITAYFKSGQTPEGGDNSAIASDL